MDEFERPLFRNRPAEAVSRSRLRLIPDAGDWRFCSLHRAAERIPIFVDHRMNVEYSVDRIVTILDDGRFVNAPLSRTANGSSYLSDGPQQVGGP